MIIEEFYKKAMNLVNDEEKRLLQELKKILKESYNNGFLEIINDKIKLNYDILIKMSKKEIFRKNSFKTYELTKKLKQKRIIDGKSRLYPKNIKLFSINPLHDVFLNIRLSRVEEILKIRDELYKSIKSFDNDVELYIYMRLFSLNRIKPKYILKINRNSFFNLNENLSMLVSVDKNNEQNYTHIEILLIDDDLSNIFKNAYNHKVENLLDAIDHIFEDNLEFYEVQKDKFLKKYNLTLTDCKRAVDFEYLINNSPLELTLKNYRLHPEITLKELEYLFPGKIPKYLIDIEEKNFKMFFNEFKEDLDSEILSVDDKNIDNYLVRPFEILDELKKIKIDKNINTFFDKKCRFIDKHLKEDELFSKILIYVKEELFKKADKRFSDKPIKINTMREYMNALFNYCFNIILKYDEINDFAILEIDQKIEEGNFTENTKKKYKEIINRFLTKYSTYTTFQVNSVIDIRRSIVFKDEFNQFITTILEQDKKLFANENYKIIKSLMRAVFSIILYNCGLRKNELRTRLQRDIVKIGDNEYIIYIDNKGFKEAEKLGDKLQFSLKTKNARRKVRFKIENKEHNKIVAKYYNWITKNNYKFFFPLATKNRLLKKQIAKESFFDELSKILKQITNRYTPFHSLRHSFATFWLLDKLKSGDYEKTIMFELANIMGHSEPETTLKNYLHLDIIKVLLKRLH